MRLLLKAGSSGVIWNRETGVRFLWKNVKQNDQESEFGQNEQNVQNHSVNFVNSVKILVPAEPVTT